MEQKRRLIFIIDSPFTDKPGGRETWITNIAAHMRKHGYETYVICRDTKRTQRYNASGELKLVRIKTLQSVIPNFLLWTKMSLGLLLVFDMVTFVIQSYRTAKRLLAEKGNQITYFVAMNTVTEGIVAACIKRRLKYPKVVVSVRGKAPLEISQTLPYLKPFAYFAERRVLHTIENIWANGYDTAEYLKKLGGRPTVIPNGVDYRTFSELRQQSTPYRVLTVMNIATLRPIKGIPQLTRAIPKIAQLTKRAFKVVLVGAGDPTIYQEYLKRKNCERFVYFPGAVPAIEAIRDADIVTCLSGGGGMSMSALEAMAAGKAIVAWDSPVYRQLIKNGESALLVPEGDTDALAKAVVDLMKSQKLRKHLGENARKAAKKYDWERVCEKMDAALRSIE